MKIAKELSHTEALLVSREPAKEDWCLKSNTRWKMGPK